jgi:protoheme IX farnesyltransferase
MAKSLALEDSRASLLADESKPLSVGERARAFFELTKPRITFEVVLVAAVGFRLGTPTGAFDWEQFFHAMFGIALLSSGISTLNQYWERDLDRLMRRTASRPLPTGRVKPAHALIFGVLLTILAEAYICPLVNPLSALLGLATAIGYVLFYTPLKTKTWLSTAIGSFPGAMPPLMGWAAAAGTIGVEAWVLFAIMFFWQFPHFYAIAWMYREDYRRAGIVMLPVIEADGAQTKRQILITALITIPFSVMPLFLGISGYLYLIGAIALGAIFLRSSMQLVRTGTNLDAKRLLRVSVLYLPTLYLLMILNQT